MGKTKHLLWVLLILIAACTSQSQESTDTGGNEATSTALEDSLHASLEPADAPDSAMVSEAPPFVRGDFDGDGKEETVRLIAPKLTDSMYVCEGECNCSLKSDAPGTKVYEIGQCIGGYPANEGDLDGNGTDEIRIIPEWWSSCWMRCIVLTLDNGKWRKLIPSFSVHCVQWEDGTDYISADPENPGTVIVRESVLEDDGIVAKERKVVIGAK